MPTPKSCSPPQALAASSDPDAPAVDGTEDPEELKVKLKQKWVLFLGITSAG